MEILQPGAAGSGTTISRHAVSHDRRAGAHSSAYSSVCKHGDGDGSVSQRTARRHCTSDLRVERRLAPPYRLPTHGIALQFSSCHSAPPNLLAISRHLSLSEIGLAGQEKLKAARVLVIGAGGLGSPALLYLAAAGIGTLGIVDFDRVDISNLQRQVLFDTRRCGQWQGGSGTRTPVGAEYTSARRVACRGTQRQQCAGHHSSLRRDTGWHRSLRHALPG